MVLRLKLLAGLNLILAFVSFSASAAAFNKKLEISFGKQKKVISVEIAETPKQHEIGLMNRKSMPVDAGMLFVFKDSEIREFWMKNTLFNLDIAYFSKDKVIVDIQTMNAVTSVLQTNLATYPSKSPAQYALEMNEGWFKKNKFPTGSKFQLLTGPTSK